MNNAGATRPRAVAKETFELARIASPSEVADYLKSLAAGLARGEVVLESGRQTLHLRPAADLKLEIVVKDREDKGKISIELAWKRRLVAKATDLRVEVGRRAPA